MPPPQQPELGSGAAPAPSVRSSASDASSRRALMASAAGEPLVRSPDASPRGREQIAASVAAPADQEGEKEEEDDDDAGYGAEHLSAVVRPVCITMALAAAAVANIRDPAQDDTLAGGLNMYLVYGGGGGGGGGSGGGGGGSSSGGQSLGEAAVNAIVIVSVICAATFLLVLCYKYRLTWLMVGYLMFASASLLGYSGSLMVATALQRWQVGLDWATLAFLMWNFAITGVVAVFWQKGVPRAVTQGYLVCVSVIMAWILSKLPEWTAWALLIALAIYDLLAVLCPYGPLRLLVNLAQTRRDPIPGLLYEATVGDGDELARQGVRDTFASGAARPPPPPARGAQQPQQPPPPQQQQLPRQQPGQTLPGTSTSGAARAVEPRTPTAAEVWAPVTAVRGGAAAAAAAGASGAAKPSTADDAMVVASPLRAIAGGAAAIGDAPPAVRAPLPVDAAALLGAVSRSSDSAGWTGRHGGAAAAADAHADELDAAEAQRGAVARDWPSPTTPRGDEQLAAAGSHASGLARQGSSSRPMSVHSVHSSAGGAHGSEAGQVQQAPHQQHQGREGGQGAAQEEEEGEEVLVADRSIKLGLGDFVFYSVLVSRAALFDASSLAACFTAVVLGLAGTLALLSIYRMALPALPISVFLGVVVYLVTRFGVTPFLDEMVVAV